MERLEKVLPVEAATSKYSPDAPALDDPVGLVEYWDTVTVPSPVASAVMLSLEAAAVPDALVDVPDAELVDPAGPTLMVRVTCGAALKLELPAWFASITQAPTPVKLTVAPSIPDTLHTPCPLVGSTVNTTGLPEAPPVALRVSDPPTAPDAGPVKLIVWSIRAGGAEAMVAVWTAGSMLRPSGSWGAHATMVGVPVVVSVMSKLSELYPGEIKPEPIPGIGVLT